MAGLPGSLGAGGGKWAMGGGGHGVPNQSVLAAQSPFNIMPGNCAKLAGQSCSPAAPGERLATHNLHYVWRPRCPASRGAVAQGWRLLL